MSVLSLPFVKPALFFVLGFGVALIPAGIAVKHAAITYTASRPGAPVDARVQMNIRNLMGALSDNTASVQGMWQGPDGLVGVLWVTKSGVKRVGWASPGGMVLLPGSAFESDKKDLTLVANRAINGKDPNAVTLPRVSNDGVVNSDAANTILVQSAHSKSFESGSGQKEITVFADPNCIICHKLWVDFAKKQKDIRIRWILVGYVKPDSAVRAASIMAAKDPLKAWDENEAKFDTDKEEGGYPLHYAADMKDVKKNLDILGHTLGMEATPTFFWRDSSGKAHGFAGLPEDWGKFIQNVMK